MFDGYWFSGWVLVLSEFSKAFFRSVSLCRFFKLSQSPLATAWRLSGYRVKSCRHLPL